VPCNGLQASFIMMNQSGIVRTRSEKKEKKANARGGAASGLGE
jgi:hypothetical protein